MLAARARVQVDEGGAEEGELALPLVDERLQGKRGAGDAVARAAVLVPQLLRERVDLLARACEELAVGGEVR